jgi:hypothetical protein
MRSRPQAVLAALLAAAVVLLPAGRAAASATQESMFQADVQMMSDPVQTVAELRDMGVQRIRVSVRWNAIAPSPNARHKPKGFNAADPAAYAARSPGVWARWDALVKAAAGAGIGLNFDVNGTYGVPQWASGPGEPLNHLRSWEPSPKEFRLFMRALGTRYSGSYDPASDQVAPGDPNDLPAVRFWSIWNEPDYGPSLSPQDLPPAFRVDHAPEMYRQLIAAAWAALHATGHARDAFVIGEVAPRGHNNGGLFSGLTPGVFFRSMYCVDARYRPLRGTQATVRGCPATAAASRGFRAANPGLFKATGVSDHPYMEWLAPNHEPKATPDFSSLAVIGQFERLLDRLQRVYGSHRHLPVYDTEFGYITSPPKHDTPKGPYVSPATAAYYLNWAEYIHWRDPRIQSFMQYQLADPVKPAQSNGWGSFASGLLNWAGKPKPTFPAWVLPLYLPRTKLHPGQPAEIWGCVRPAHYAIPDTGLLQTAYIQYSPGAHQAFTNLAPVAIATAGNCYFDTHLALPGSGRVRLMWQYPTSDPMLANPVAGGSTVYSRTIQVTVG